MAALGEVTADQLEALFHEVLKRGDGKGVEAALILLAVKDPHRAQRLFDLTQAALDICRKADQAIAAGEAVDGEVIQLHEGSRACTPCYLENPRQYEAFPTLCPHHLADNDTPEMAALMRDLWRGGR